MALLVALIAFAAWLVRAGSAISFFCETVLVGFKAGLALYLASTQLPKLFGHELIRRGELFRPGSPTCA